MTEFEIANQGTVKEVKANTETIKVDAAAGKTAAEAVNVNIGSNSDAASASGGKLFSLVKYIATTAGTILTNVGTAITNISTANTNINTINTNVSANKTTLAAVNTNVSTVNNNIGAPGNAANGGGTTLFALLKYAANTVATIATNVSTVINNLAAANNNINAIKAQTANSAKYLQRQNPLSGTSPEKSGTHNVVNLTGPGVFHLIELTTTATHNTQKFSVSIDGVALYSNIIVPASSSSLTLLQKDTYFKGSLVVTIISSTIASSKWSCHYSLYK